MAADFHPLTDDDLEFDDGWRGDPDPFTSGGLAATYETVALPSERVAGVCVIPHSDAVDPFLATLRQEIPGSKLRVTDDLVVAEVDGDTAPVLDDLLTEYRFMVDGPLVRALGEEMGREPLVSVEDEQLTVSTYH